MPRLALKNLAPSLALTVALLDKGPYPTEAKFSAFGGYIGSCRAYGSLSRALGFLRQTPNTDPRAILEITKTPKVHPLLAGRSTPPTPVAR